MPPPIFAHLGHWYVSLPIFMGPALLVVVVLKVQTRRERDLAPGDPRGARRVLVSRVGQDTPTTVLLHGRLDYPALLELEVELGGVASSTRELRLDLTAVSDVDSESAWLLCDSLGSMDRPVTALLAAGNSLGALREALAAEGIRVQEVRLTDAG
jgi:ABC-type transporter Mla MlaB component